MNFSLQIGGLEELARNLEALPERILHAAAAAFYQEAEQVMTESKGLVPVDTGVLRDSGFVELPVIGPREVSVTLGYGGAAADYAVVQHEDLTLRHPNGGQAKFLEQPLLERAEGMGPRVAAHVRQELGA